jgi:general stress protein 26
MEVASFTELEQEFIDRAHRVVWCNVATIDGRGRPRSRILHPIWEGGTGWVITRRHSFKEKHLAGNPYVSLAYVAEIAKPVYVDCTAGWSEERADKRRIWDAFKGAPEPLGYDPGTIFPSIDDPGLGLLKLTPWRVELGSFPGTPLVWHAPPGG